MWHTMKEKEPKNGKKYPVWVKASHSGHEFSDFAFYYDGEWSISGKFLDAMGWEFIAWFELPDYK